MDAIGERVMMFLERNGAMILAAYVIGLTFGFVVMAHAADAPAQTGVDSTAVWMARTIGADPQSATISPVDAGQLVFARGAQMACDGSRSITINRASYARWVSMWDGSVGFDQMDALIVLHELAHGLSPVSCSPDANHVQDEAIVQAAALSLLSPWTGHFFRGKVVASGLGGIYEQDTRQIRRQVVSITGVRDPSRPAAKRFIWCLLLADQSGRDAMLGGG